MAAKKRPTWRQPPKPPSASRIPQRLTTDALVYAEYEITDEPLDNRDIKKLPSQVQAPDFSIVLFRPNFMLASEKHPMKTHKNQWLLNLLFPLIPPAEPRTRAHTMVSGVQTPSQ